MLKRPAFYIHIFAILCLVGIWLTTQDLPATRAEGLITGVAMLAAALVCLWTHEIGHILGALAMRLRITNVYLWPYHFSYSGAWKFEAYPHGNFLVDGGFYPTSLSGARKKLIVALLSGFLATLVVGVLALIPTLQDQRRIGNFALILDPTVSGWEIFDYRFLTSLWLFCAALIIVSAFPARDKNPFWDGPFLARLLANGPQAERRIAQYAMSGLVDQERPREWPEEWLQAMEGDSDPTLSLTRHFRAYERYLDLNQIEKAKGHLDEALRIAADHPMLHSNSVYVERIFLYAWLNLDEFDLEGEFQKYQKRSHSWIANYRADCMLRIRDGRPDEAVALAVRGRDGIRESFNYGVWQMYADWFDRIIERAFTDHAVKQQNLPSSSRAESG